MKHDQKDGKSGALENPFYPSPQNITLHEKVRRNLPQCFAVLYHGAHFPHLGLHTHYWEVALRRSGHRPDPRHRGDLEFGDDAVYGAVFAQSGVQPPRIVGDAPSQTAFLRFEGSFLVGPRAAAFDFQLTAARWSIHFSQNLFNLCLL